MSAFRVRLESGFEHLGRVTFRNRLKVLALCLLFAGGLISQVPQITFDTSTESFFHADDPALIQYNDFREQFGRDEFIVIAIHPPNVFEQKFLGQLRRLHDDLETSVPHIKEVTSLVNARLTRGEGDELIVEDLIQEIPDSDQLMSELKQRTLGSELYPNLVVSQDGRFTTILLETTAYSDGGNEEGLLSGFDGGDSPAKPGQLEQKPLSDQENSEIVRAVEAILTRYRTKDFPVVLSGSPVVTDHLKRSMQGNMRRFVLLSLTAISLFLLFLFRRFSGVLLPMMVVLLGVASSVGMMSLLNVSFKLPLMILPSFLLAVGIGGSVHLLAVFYRHYQNGHDKEGAVVFAMGHSGLPILMTGLTTSAGLASFSTASLAAVADLGIFASIGVLLSLGFTLVMVPALLALLPLREKPRFLRDSHGDLADRILTTLGNFSTRRAVSVLVGFALLLALSAAGLPLLNFSHNSLLWFKKTDPVRQSTELIDRELKGSITVEMVIDTGRENGLYDPAVLQALDDLARYALNYQDAQGAPFIGKTISVADVVKEIHRALNENRQDFYRLPDNRELIAQELLLFENSGSNDLERIIDSQFSMARITLKAPWRDAAAYVTFMADLEDEGRRIFAGMATLTTTGLLKLFNRTIFALMNSMVTSYSIAIVVIAVLMILLIGRLRVGLLSMIPNLTPIVITLGFMGWSGIHLDAFTLLIGSIALGLAVDDTIHFFHNYQRYYLKYRQPEKSVEETLLTTGRAMLFTTLVLATGFWLYMFASLNNLFYFGLLTGITLVLALLADLMVAPAMMTVAHRFASHRSQGN